MLDDRPGRSLDFGETHREPQELNLIPLINVVFLLLIFFLFASTLTTPDSMEITLPEAASGAARESEPIVVLIGAGGEIALNNRPVVSGMLSQEIGTLIAAGSSQTLMIKADAAATTSNVLDVLRQARAAGAERVALATEASGP